jgi:DNA-binding NtrC family response regulator
VAQAAEPSRPAINGRLETVLVVEDNERLRRATVRQLVELGYRTFEVEDAQAARTVLDINDAVSLVFSYVVMPGGMDGIELVEWALARRPGLRCLLTSGFADLAAREERLRALGCRLLSKPYRREELARAVRDALDNDRSPPRL